MTPRRFLALANPSLRELLDRTIGDGWLTDLDRLRGLEPFVDDAAFRAQWRDIKRGNKARLAKYLRTATGIELNPDWMFDIQVKRIHEYKRQHLSVLHIIALYHRLKQNPGLSIPQRAFRPRNYVSCDRQRRSGGTSSHLASAVSPTAGIGW